MAKQKKKFDKATLGKVLRYIRRHLPLLCISILLATVTVALTLYLPILFGNAIDCIVAPGQVDFLTIGRLLIEAAVVIALTAVAGWLMNICNNRITYHVVRDIRADAFRKIQKLPLSYLDTHSTGDLLSRVTADAEQFSDGLLMGFTQLFTGVLTILGTLFFMVRLSWQIALVVVLVTPLSLIVAAFIASRTHSMFQLQSKTRGEQTAFVEEMLTGQKVVRAFRHEDEAMKQFDEINERLSACSLRATFFSSLTNPCTRFVNSVVYAAVALVGALLVIRSDGTVYTAAGIAMGAEKAAAVYFTVGNLSSLLAYANQYTKPFNEISGVITELQNSLACASRLFELMEAPAESDDSALPEMGKVAGAYALTDVCFSYVPEKPLIEGLNLTVSPGQRVAIVGPTGCGKTTMINLLMRFYDVKDGSIALDGQDVRGVTRHSLRKNYGMVLQETWLKAGTIRENIVMGRPDATDEEVIAAAKAAHAHSFIRRLPDGYDTVIGEDGGMLSAGQKQLLCITRIMLCLPPLLILDEATSSIDTRTEQKIQSAFAKLMKGRTSFIVAHRLSTIREADIILVMKDGNIIEQGDHDTLLHKGGFYADLWNSQFED
ncbi:MAG: ABC transporter ATP-binding protein [Clostridia bacterium]|nr:ABC transporter ATP-binding protein [Clostridia bacterium]